MLLSELNKVLPLLKQGFYVKWQGSKVTPSELNGWYEYRTFVERYDFKKIQVIKCDRYFYYGNDFDLDLILKKL